MRYLLAPALMLGLVLPAQAQTGEDFETRLERVEDITGVLERACLSGHEVSGKASLDAGISGLKKILTDGLSGNLSAEAAARDARGAIGILKDEVKLDENAAIRRCMAPFLEKIVNYLLVEDQAGDAGQCWDITVKHPKRFPYYLKNSITVMKDFYWFFVDIDNRCSSTLHASVTFKPDLPEKDLPAVEYLKGAELMTLKAGERKDKTIDPRIRFLAKLDKPFPMKVDWRVKDDKDQLLGQGSVDIEVLPPNHFVWTLHNADDKAIDKEILLASLAAWPQGRPQAVSDATNRVLDAVDEHLDAEVHAFARHWMAALHSDVFGAKRAIRVLPTAKRFPPRNGSRPIRAPVEVFERKRSNPLEAALLIHAITGDIFEEYGIDQVLVVAPDPDRAGRQAVMLAWTETEAGNWSAIRTGVLGRKAFDENLATATAAFNRLLESNSIVANGLQAFYDDDGMCRSVVLDEVGGVYAIDPLRAKRCGIAGLPF